MGSGAARAEATSATGAQPQMPAGPYRADWNSIKEYPKCPEWFADAKFGIYTHWTPQSIPEAAANGSGYPTYMYNDRRAQFKFHQEHYGDQKKFGFKDFIPMFTAEKFDAEQWAELFAAAGAKFAGPVAVHHDNFAMWDSQATKWNAKNMGLKKDVSGLLAKAYKEKGMKFIATFHHSWTWGYYAPASLFDGADPDTWQLYGEPRQFTRDEKKGNYANADFPTKRYLDQWLSMVREVVTQYEPDMIWFDIGLDGRKCVTPEYQQQMFADYYNWATAKGKGVLVGHKEGKLLPITGIKDYERGRSETLQQDVWMTDGTLGHSWFYQPKFDGEWHDANWVIDILMDIVAKNGVLLLNVPPRPDGSIPEEGAVQLRKMGEWLRINGDAVYNTRPWMVYGEPHKKLSARHGRGDEQLKVVYTQEDLRFTQSKDGKRVNVIVLGWPEAEFTVKSIKVDDAAKDAAVTLLGSKEKIKFRINDQRQLVIVPPAEKPCDFAYSFQLQGFKLSPHEAADKNTFAAAQDSHGLSNEAE